MTYPVVYHQGYEAPLRAGGRFAMSKYGCLRRRLGRAGVMRPGGWFAPAEAGAAAISLAHDPAYVERVFTQTLRPAEARRIGLPNAPATARRVRLSSAGTTLAARLALEHGLAMHCAGGSHHAAQDAGSGYCVFNDVAVAAATLLAEGVIRSALVIDLDVHQGDGTARIFAGDPRVFTLSLHAEKNFPARKARSDFDAGLPDGLGDADYLRAVEDALTAAPQAPDLVFFNAGVDVVAGDRLGRLSLSAAGLRARDRAALRWAAKRGAPLVGVLGGGYGDDPDEVAARHAVTFEEAARRWRRMT